MIIAAANLTELLSDTAWTMFIVFVRTGAVVALLPGFGERSVPMRVKLMVALAFTLLIAPGAPTQIAPLSLTSAAASIWIEALIGSAMGIALRLFVIALQTAGSIAAQSTSLAQLAGGTVEPIPAMGNVLVMAGLALAVTLGLHVKAAYFILSSYQLLPTGHLPDPGILSQWGVAQIAAAFRLAFSLAAPFVIASFIYNLTLGVINRAMPQLMVAFVGAPFTTMGGLVVLFLATPLILSQWHQAFEGVLAADIGALP